MTRPLPTHTDRLTVCAPGEPPNKVAPHDGPLPAGAERLLWVDRWRYRMTAVRLPTPAMLQCDLSGLTGSSRCIAAVPVNRVCKSRSAHQTTITLLRAAKP